MSGFKREVELLFKGDNRSAVRALEGVAQQSDKTKRQVRTDAEEQSLAMDRVREHTNMLRDSMGGLMGMVGIGGVAFGIKDLVEGGMNLTEQQAQLQTALRATGQAAGGASDQLDRMAEHLSEHGGFTTTQNLSALTAFVRETHSAAEAQRLLTLSTNIARGRNMDLASAQQTVARAYTGNVGRLQQLLGPMVAAREAQVGLTVAHQKDIAAIQAQAALMRGPLKTEYVQQAAINDHITAQQLALAQMTDKHTTAQQMLAAATKVFAGSTSTYASTAQGKVSDVKHSFQNLTDELGKSLLPTVDMFLGKFEDVAVWMSHNKQLVLDLTLGFAGLGAAMGVRTLIKELAGLKTDLEQVAIRFGLMGSAAEKGGAEATVAMEETAAATGGAGVAGAAGEAGLLGRFMKGGLAKGLMGGALGGLTASQLRDMTGIGNHHGHHSSLGALIGTVGGGFLGSVIGPEGTMLGAAVGAGIGNLAGGFLGGLFNHGGIVPRYLASGGPVGSDTVPAWLSPGEGVVTSQGMNAIGQGGLNAINNGFGMGGRMVTLQPVAIVVDGREILRTVLRQTLNDAARGPSSFTGGSLVTGAPGLVDATLKR